MKTNALLVFFFLVALFASTRADYVRDSEGHIVHSGGIYYLVPQDFAGAAIVATSIENPDGCSLAVVEKLLNNKGNAVIIEAMARTAYITTSSSFHLSFHPLPSNNCTKHPQWIIVMDEDFGQNAVMVGARGEFEFPVTGLFYFKTYNSAKHQYNLVFCSNQYTCGPVAIKTDGYENRRLIIAEQAASVKPLVLKLVKTSGDRVASHVSMVV
ncbi:hypothetical protein QN277_000193 [Acacia crassicarpa]|uniref:Uncharacterized protein n=1 Tax=Acacia crassicarpa TaxID=499986 RepID=A0AAE1TFJ6_9FABA|nr:hypothetical protein QN277_000193 [Acacia crassicarpa]